MRLRWGVEWQTRGVQWTWIRLRIADGSRRAQRHGRRRDRRRRRTFTTMRITAAAGHVGSLASPVTSVAGRLSSPFTLLPRAVVTSSALWVCWPKRDNASPASTRASKDHAAIEDGRACLFRARRCLLTS